MDIREVGEDEQERAVYIGRQAFAHGRRSSASWLRDPNRPDSTMLGVWDESGLQARLSIIAFQVHLGPDVVAPMGGIGGVACLPDARGKGYAGELLKAALERMRDAGQVISSLFPFSWDFYRQYGWEWVGLNRTYFVPTRILKPHPQTEYIRALKPEDRPRLEACYAQFAGRYRGMLARDEKRWNSILQDREEDFTFSYLYAPDGNAEGYLTFHGGTENETRLRELIALTPRACFALLGLLRRHEMQTQKFVWDAPGNDPLYQQLCHNDVETRLEPLTQGRIVDVAGALAAWKPNALMSGAVNLAVQDEHAPWNAGVWRIEFEAGNVVIKRTDAAPQVSLAIQALSQAYYGTPTVEEIRAAEHIAVHDENGYATLCALLDGPPAWTRDGF